MKIKYLGTAAAEGFPGLFCNCPTCAQARRLGGKDIRTRSQAILDGELLLDFPCDTNLHALREGLDLSAVHTLLVTHSHTDHFYPADLAIRGGCYAHAMSCAELDIYCNAVVREYFYRAAGQELEPVVESGLSFHIASPFEPFAAGPYRVTPLPARHIQTEQALFYLIEREGRALLYAHDTGQFFPQVYEYLRQKHVRLDLVSLDCTCGPMEAGEEGGHMGIPDNLAVRDRLLETGAVTANTRFVINHFSHNGGLLYEELRKQAEPLGFTVSYDGLQMDV